MLKGMVDKLPGSPGEDNADLRLLIPGLCQYSRRWRDEGMFMFFRYLVTVRRARL